MLAGIRHRLRDGAPSFLYLIPTQPDTVPDRGRQGAETGLHDRLWVRHCRVRRTESTGLALAYYHPVRHLQGNSPRPHTIGQCICLLHWHPHIDRRCTARSHMHIRMGSQCPPWTGVPIVAFPWQFASAGSGVFAPHMSSCVVVLTLTDASYRQGERASLPRTRTTFNLGPFIRPTLYNRLLPRLARNQPGYRA